jgi:hypothetical protein
MELFNAVICVINCDYCDSEFGDFNDVSDAAEGADEEGWEVNRAGKVKCPDCVNKMKKQ